MWELERRDSIGEKPRIDASEREQLAVLRGKLQRGVPERILKIRRAIRHKDRKALEMELLKLSAALPPEFEAGDEEWRKTREGLTTLEEVIEQLRDSLERLID